MKKAISLFLALIMCLSLCACGKSEAVKETEQAIKAIGKVTMSSQDAIEEASNLFDALTSEEQAKVSNRNDLSKAKDEFQGLVDYYIEIADRIVSAYTPQLGQAQAHYFGFFFITIGALTILHYGKSYFTCDCIVSTFAENPQKAEQQIKCPPPTGEADFES